MSTVVRRTVRQTPRKAPQHAGFSSHSPPSSPSISLPLPMSFPGRPLPLGLSDFVEQACCWTMSLKPWLPLRATARPSSPLMHCTVIITRLMLCVLWEIRVAPPPLNNLSQGRKLLLHSAIITYMDSSGLLSLHQRPTTQLFPPLLIV